MQPINPQEISVLNRLRMVKAFISVVRDVKRTNEVFELSERLPDSATLSAVDYISKGPFAERAFREQTIMPKIELTEMRALPEGTLGREYARFMDKQGLDPEFYPRKEVTSRAMYLRQHLYQTHDLWHVVTGFETTPSGEIGLQAFYYAQVDLPLPIMLIAAGLLNGLLFDPHDVTNRIEQISRGWRMGGEAKLIFGYPWQERLATPLTDVRRELGLNHRDNVSTLQHTGTA